MTGRIKLVKNQNLNDPLLEVDEQTPVDGNGNVPVPTVRPAQRPTLTPVEDEAILAARQQRPPVFYSADDVPTLSLRQYSGADNRPRPPTRTSGDVGGPRPTRRQKPANGFRRRQRPTPRDSGDVGRRPTRRPKPANRQFDSALTW